MEMGGCREVDASRIFWWLRWGMGERWRGEHPTCVGGTNGEEQNTVDE